MSKSDDRVRAWLHKIRSGQDFPCPVCNADEWSQDPPVGLPTVRLQSNGDVSSGLDDPSLVLIPIRCRSCGLTLFLDADTANLFGEES